MRPEPDPAVVQSTLCAFTAESIWLGIEKWMPPVERIVVCGGGAHNQAIVKRLDSRLSGLEVATTQVYGISPDDVEACAFAWLAERRVNGIPANLPSVTGASRPCIAGFNQLPLTG